METSEYLEQLLLRYEETYDIYKPYYIDGKEYPAYGYFTSDIREQNPEKTGNYGHLPAMSIFYSSQRIK